MPENLETGATARAHRTVNEFKSELPSGVDGVTRFMFDSVTAALGGEISDPSATPEAPLDWNLVLDRSDCHGILPQLHLALETERLRDVPEWVRQQVKTRFCQIAARNLSLTYELTSVTRILADAGIASIAIKGPALAAFAFGNLAMRQFGDIDVLVDGAEFAAASQALIAEHYVPARNSLDVPDYMNRTRQHTLVSPRGAEIDIQYALLPASFPEVRTVRQLLSGTVPLEVNGFSLRSLAGEDLLVFLCMHGSKHGWNLLGWVRDVAQLLKSHREIDWESVLERSSQKSIRRMLLTGLRLASFVISLPLPEEIVSAIRADSTVRWISDSVARRSLSGPGPMPTLFHDWVLPAASLYGTRDRLKYLLDRGLRPTPDDWRTLPMRRAGYPIYFLIRPIRLLFQHGPRLLGAPAQRSGHKGLVG